MASQLKNQLLETPVDPSYCASVTLQTFLPPSTLLHLAAVLWFLEILVSTTNNCVGWTAKIQHQNWWDWGGWSNPVFLNTNYYLLPYEVIAIQ